MADHPTIFDSFEHLGHFWLPETPDRKQPGLLRFTNQRIELELLGLIAGTAQDVMTDELPPVSCILGLTAQGEHLTLHQCVSTYANVGTGMAGFTAHRSKFSARHLLIGDHFPAPADQTFPRVCVSFFNLESWVGHNPFKFNKKPITNDDGTTTYLSEYVRPAHRFFVVPPIDAEIGIQSSYTRSATAEFKQETRTHTAWLTLKPNGDRNIAWFFDRIAEIQNLLALLMGKTTFPRMIRLDGPEIELAEHGSQRLNETRWYFCPSLGKPIEPTSSFELLTGLGHLSDEQFSTVLSSWFTKQEVLRAVCDLFFGVLYNTYLYRRFHFLGLIQALETYCRLSQPGQYVSEAEYKIIADALTAAIPFTTPQDLKNSLRHGKIKYGNEYALRKRLRLLLCSLEDDTGNMVTEYPGEFVEKVVATRNYYTHYTSELHAQAFDEPELYRACIRLRVLLTIILFKELGLEESVIRHIWLYSANSSPLARAVKSKYADC
jgi:hypothetical protein